MTRSFLKGAQPRQKKTAAISFLLVLVLFGQTSGQDNHEVLFCHMSNFVLDVARVNAVCRLVQQESKGTYQLIIILMFLNTLITLLIVRISTLIIVLKF
jgi:hypothetical protein